MTRRVNFRNLSHEDLARVFEINTRLHEIDPQDTFPTHLYNLLSDSLSTVHFCTGLFGLKPFSIMQHEVPTVDPRWNVIVEQHAIEHPFVQILMSNPSTHLARTPQGKFQSTVLYNDVYAKIQSQHQLWIGIRDGDQVLNCIYSRTKPYGNKSTAMLRLIMPHVEQTWRLWKKTNVLRNELHTLKEARFQSEEEEQEATQLRKTFDLLTNRQRDVVELLATGFDNQQIAEELMISVLTVKKHLQMVFKNLGVRHRTQLAAQWHQAHSVAFC